MPPALNDMYRPNFNGRKGVRKTAECESWEMEVRILARLCEPIRKPQGVEMELRIYYKFERDIDSCSKALNDCLQGLMYDDDRQIRRLVITKEKDAGNPRLEVECRPIAA